MASANDREFVPESFPRVPLYAAIALVAFALAAAAAVRLGGVGVSATPPAATLVARDLHFEDRPDGGIDVRDARDGRRVETVAPGTNGFLRSTLRGLARERKRQSIGAQAPFRLTSRADGRLTLEDPATGRRVDLEAFGTTNAGVFARLLALPAQSS